MFINQLWINHIIHSPRQCNCGSRRIYFDSILFTSKLCRITQCDGSISRYQKNMLEFALRNVKFLTLVDPNIVWVRDTIDALRATLAEISSTCPFDQSICGATSLRMHQFSRKRQRSSNGKIAGEKETIPRRLYVHVYYSCYQQRGQGRTRLP